MEEEETIALVGEEDRSPHEEDVFINKSPHPVAHKALMVMRIDLSVRFVASKVITP